MRRMHESRLRNRIFHRVDLNKEDENPSPGDDASARHM